MDSIESAVERALGELGDPSLWDRPKGYSRSLALCVVDSIWSLGIRYETVEKILDSYLKARGLNGVKDAQTCTDGPSDLLKWFTDPSGCSGSPDKFAEIVDNRNRTSSVNGILKAEAVVQGCNLMASLGIDTTHALILRADEVQRKWMSEIKGQSSGISWKYLLMLAGQSGVKPDRMVKRFMSRMGISGALSPEDFIDALVRRIDLVDIDATAIDHQIWLLERHDSIDELKVIQNRVNQFAEDRLWDQFHSVKNLFVALVGEVGEIAEILQWKSDSEITEFLSTSKGITRLGEEVADVFIYLLRIADMAGIDLVEATNAKILINAEKYPIEISRGKSTKYSDGLL